NGPCTLPEETQQSQPCSVFQRERSCFSFRREPTGRRAESAWVSCGTEHVRRLCRASHAPRKVTSTYARNTALENMFPSRFSENFRQQWESSLKHRSSSSEHPRPATVDAPAQKVAPN